MVDIAPQYADIMTWKVDKTHVGIDEMGQPIYIEGDASELICRLEDFRAGSMREFMGRNGVTILSDGVVYCKAGLKHPSRFDLVELKGKSYQVLHVSPNFYNTTIYIKEALT